MLKDVLVKHVHRNDGKANNLVHCSSAHASLKMNSDLATANFSASQLYGAVNPVHGRVLNNASHRLLHTLKPNKVKSNSLMAPLPNELLHGSSFPLLSACEKMGVTFASYENEGGDTLPSLPSLSIKIMNHTPKKKLIDFTSTATSPKRIDTTTIAVQSNISAYQEYLHQSAQTLTLQNNSDDFEPPKPNICEHFNDTMREEIHTE